MATQDDQPRPDLDAAVDAVLPSLATVSDEAAAASLRRTRLALAARADARRASAWGWGVAATATAGAIVLVSVSLWRQAPARWPSAPIDTPRIVARHLPPAVTPAPPAIAPVRRTPTSAPAAVPPSPKPLRQPRVAAASTPIGVDVRPEADPVIALAHAIQEIPDEAWDAAQARAESPIGAADLSVAPIVVPPLVTPPIADSPPAAPVQGEP